MTGVIRGIIPQIHLVNCYNANGSNRNTRKIEASVTNGRKRSARKGVD